VRFAGASLDSTATASLSVSECGHHSFDLDVMGGSREVAMLGSGEVLEH
jgi:hypothetical protein